MSKNVKKKNTKFKYFIIFLLFLFAGIGLGIFGTIKILNNIDNEKVPVIDDGPVDITDDVKYQDIITSLRDILNEDPMFYSTSGVVASTLDNTSRLNLIYYYVINNNLGSAELLNVDYEGASTCKSGVFIVDSNVSSVSTICTTIKIPASLFEELNNQLFNDDVLDISVNFNVGVDKKCIVDAGSYLCGSITNVSGYTGELESKFEVIKVTKDNSGVFEIYEKGYLVDNRSYVDNPTDQYDNYYLHSSDSKDYYYELKSADNLIFKHTFKTIDNENYYYVETKLVKE